MGKICSFFGHRNIILTAELENRIEEVISELVLKENVDTFYFGGFGDFDEYCHKAVSRLREKHPNIKRIFCLSDERQLRKSKRPRYLKDTDYEEFVYLTIEFDYWYSRIYYRNCEMINQSDYIVFYIRDKENSGAYKSFQYAQKHKKQIIEL